MPNEAKRTYDITLCAAPRVGHVRVRVPVSPTLPHTSTPDGGMVIVALTVREGVTDGMRDGVPEDDGDTDLVVDTDTLPVIDADGTRDAEPDLEGVTDRVQLPLLLGLTVTDTEGTRDAVPDTEGVPDRVILPLAEFEKDGVTVRVQLPLLLALAVIDTDSRREMEGDPERDMDGVSVTDTVGLTDTEIDVQLVLSDATSAAESATA